MADGTLPPIDHMRRLWERMTALYGASWIRTNGLTPQNPDGTATIAGDTWTRALAGVTPQQFAIGLEACRVEGAEFAPSAPRFAAMCRGIPSLARVQFELRNPEQAGDFTHAVWAYVDGYAYRQASADKAQQMLRAAYDLAHDLAMSGKPLPTSVIAGALEHQRGDEPQGIPRRGDTSDAARDERERHMAAQLGEFYTPPENRGTSDAR